MSGIQVIEGYQISTLFEDEQPRVRDVEVAERLGARLDKLRELINRNAEELNDFAVLPKMGETSTPLGGRRPQAYWLTRDQVLVVCMRSNAPNARLVRKQMVQVFSAYLDGRMAPALDPGLRSMIRVLAESNKVIAEAVVALKTEAWRRMDAIERMAEHCMVAPECISPSDLADMKRRVLVVAKKRVVAKLSKSVDSARQSCYQQIRQACGWFGVGARLDNIPASAVPAMKRELARLEHNHAKIELERQESLLRLVP